MYASTIISPWEIADWFGVDPWLMAGIDLDANQVNPQANGERCSCVMEKAWMSGEDGNCLSRDTFIRAIQRAENLFRAWAGTNPAPAPVTEERHNLNYVWKPGGGVRTPGITPMLNRVQAVGMMVLTQIANAVPLDKGEGCEGEADGVPDVVFTTAPFPVPDNTLHHLMHVYLIPSDGRYIGTPALKHEIRGPELVIEVDSSGGAGNWTATITAPAYYFVRPDLQQNGECLPHECDTYLDAVDVYIESVNACQQGDFIFAGDNCDVTPCAETTKPLCYEKRNGLFIPVSAECVMVDQQTQRRAYCLSSRPIAATINYIAGMPTTAGVVDPLALDAVSMLTMALVECPVECCNCCMQRKWDYYRREAKITTREPRSDSEPAADVDYKAYTTEGQIRALHGLPPLIGILEAYAMIYSANLRGGVSSIRA